MLYDHGPNPDARSNFPITVEHLFCNSWTTSELTKIAIGKFSVARHASMTFGWLDYLCHSRPLQGRRHQKSRRRNGGRCASRPGRACMWPLCLDMPHGVQANVSQRPRAAEHALGACKYSPFGDDEGDGGSTWSRPDCNNIQAGSREIWKPIQPAAHCNEMYIGRSANICRINA